MNTKSPFAVKLHAMLSASQHSHRRTSYGGEEVKPRHINQNPYVGDQLNVIAAKSLVPILESKCTSQGYGHDMWTNCPF